MGRYGYSYIEVIISMTLICVFSFSIANGFGIVIKNYKFANENYFADIAIENLLNAAHYEMDTKKSVEDILLNGQENFYTDKFNFIIRVNEIKQDFSVSTDNFSQFNYGAETFLPIQTQIFSDNGNLFADIGENGAKNYLITVDLYSKENKFLKRMVKFIT